MYDESIKVILNINDISEAKVGHNYLCNKLKIIGEEEGYKINEGFILRLKHRIYSWYVDSDHLLFRFMCHRGSFREDINKICVLCKKSENGMTHVINECNVIKNEREKLLNELNTINKRKDNELLNIIDFHYFSKGFNKAEDKVDKRIIKLIKEFIQMLYIKMNSDKNNEKKKKEKK